MEQQDASSKLFQASLLALLTLQNVLLNVTSRWSMVLAETREGSGAAKTSMITMCELIKIIIAFALLGQEQASMVEAARAFWTQTVQQPYEAAKLLVPSGLYVIQNNLLLVAAENLEGPVLAVFAQGKLLTTAVFSIILLRKKIAARQWMALFVLTVGVSAVQLAQTKQQRHEGDAGSKNLAFGLIVMICVASISGLAGVYFEKVLKGSDISLWVRNIHLAIIGVIFGLVVAFSSERKLIYGNGFFGGYNIVTWMFIFVQSAGGLIVAAVVKYMDNIIKGFATSAGILVTVIVSMIFFNFPLRFLFFVGAGCVIYSIVLYGDMLKSLPLCHACPLCLGGANREIPSPNPAESEPVVAKSIGCPEESDENQ